MRRRWIITALLLPFLVSALADADQQRQAETATAKAEALEQAVAPDAKAAEPSESSTTRPITTHEVQAVDPAGNAPLEDPITCLARTLYWEAKGASMRDLRAVANVVMNRLANEQFPSTICDVVTQGSEQPPCQFSWWCDGRTDDVAEPDAYETAREVARQAINLKLADHTGGALYFHHRTVTPDWSKVYRLTAETTEFLFYRPDGDSAR